MFQAWVATGELKEASSLMLTTGILGAAADSQFESFRNSSCSQPLLYRDGLAPRVGRSGSVQVVQSLRILPPSLHPRCFLTCEYGPTLNREIRLGEPARSHHLHLHSPVCAGELMARLSESIWVPIFDLSHPSVGAIAVIEAFISSKAPESMLLADFISYVSSAVPHLNLSVTSPEPQPERKSTLSSSRRAAAPQDSSVRDAGRPVQHSASTPPAAGVPSCDLGLGPVRPCKCLPNLPATLKGFLLPESEPFRLFKMSTFAEAPEGRCSWKFKEEREHTLLK
jgi:hypothetical protein